MANKPQPAKLADRKLVGLAWIAQRWGCSRQTCRRVLQRCEVTPLFLGGDARNATLRFDLADVLRVEASAQGRRLAAGGVGESSAEAGQQ
jgi:hypothetical protein